MSTSSNFYPWIYNAGPNYVMAQAQHQVTAPSPGITSPGTQQFQTSPNFVPPTSPSPPTPKEKEAQVLGWEEFSKLLPEELANAPERPQPGSLPDARFYTPKNWRKDHYLVFPSKADYIANFVHYYFSTNNLSRDTKLQDLMEGSATVPLESLLKFPKLSQVNTSAEDLIVALTDSFKVKVVTMAGGAMGVMRKDEWSPFQSTPMWTDNSQAQQVAVSPAAASTAPTSTSSPLPLAAQQPQQHTAYYPHPTAIYHPPIAYASLSGGQSVYPTGGPSPAYMEPQFIHQPYGAGASVPLIYNLWGDSSGYPYSMAVHATAQPVAYNHWPHTQ